MWKDGVKMSENSKKYSHLVFGRRFKALLASTSEQQLADALGISSTSTFRQWTGGYTLPTCENLKKLSEYFNVPADYLLGISNVKSYNLTAQSLHKSTGLSETAIWNLRAFSKSSKMAFNEDPLCESMRFVNALLEDESDTGALFIICTMIGELMRGNQPEMSRADKLTMDGGRYLICRDALSDLIKEIVKKGTVVYGNGKKTDE